MSNYTAFALMRKYKSQGLGVLVSGVFGGLGLLYSSIIGGFIIIIIELITGFCMGQYIAETNSSAFWYVFHFTPEYNLTPYISIFLICRVIAVIISYLAIEKHNANIDSALELMEYNNGRNFLAEKLNIVENKEVVIKKAKDNSTLHLIITFATAIIIVTLVLVVRQYNKEGYGKESFADGDTVNNSKYIVVDDSVWLYNAPSTIDPTNFYFRKGAKFISIKERNGFIYISNPDNNDKLIYGWLPLSAVKQS